MRLQLGVEEYTNYYYKDNAHMDFLGIIIHNYYLLIILLSNVTRIIGIAHEQFTRKEHFLVFSSSAMTNLPNY